MLYFLEKFYEEMIEFYTQMQDWDSVERTFYRYGLYLEREDNGGGQACKERG